MESLIINIIIGFWLVAFGAMAIFPFVIESKAGRRTTLRPVEDQIISIQPVAMHDRARHAVDESAVAAEPASRQAA